MAAPCSAVSANTAKSADTGIQAESDGVRGEQARHTPRNPRTLMGLDFNECRFPLNDKPRGSHVEFIMCGDPVLDPKVSYCRYHCSVAFDRTWGRPRARHPTFLPVDRLPEKATTPEPDDDRLREVEFT